MSVIFENSNAREMYYGDTKIAGAYAGNVPVFGPFLSSEVVNRTYTSIVFPDDCVEIPHHVCFKNTKLTSVTIPQSVVHISGSAFSNCTALRKITIPSSVHTIDGTAFYRSGLRSVTLSQGVTVIENSAFSECDLRTLTLPKSVDELGFFAFSSNANLSKVTILSTPSKIEDTVFKSCTNLLNIYCNFSEGEVANAPWGATNATIHYNSTGPEA